MIGCNDIRSHLGQYLDGEAAPDVRREVETHLCLCGTCKEELHELQSLAEAIAGPKPVAVPPELWPRIESQLDRQASRARFAIFLSRGAVAVAACIVVAVGLRVFTLPGSHTGSAVQAATVDFTALLDGMQTDARDAFERFLATYQANEVTPLDAKRYAPRLSFDLPATLPGGFELRVTYILRFGDAPGVAARYERDGEFLGAIFHPPVLREDFGTHKDHSCVVGKHRGHKVPIGEWSLVHLTEPSTCHCVLSRLDERAELPAVMAAVAPGAASPQAKPDDHHEHAP